MGESLLPQIVLTTAFFSCTFVLVVAVAPLIIESQRPTMVTNAPINVIDAVMEDSLQTWPPDPYTVTGDEDHTYWDFNGDPVEEFDPGGGEEHPLKMWIVRNDPYAEATEDYFVFQQIYGWFGMEEAHVRIPYNLIETGYDTVVNFSRVQIDLRYTFDIFFWAGQGVYLPTAIWDGSFNVTVAVGMNDTLDSLSPWGMVGKIITFRLPGTNWVMAALIATPIYMMLFYMAFCIIRSVIPLLSG